MPNNLTRDEARERARLLNVASYDVELDLTTGHETFRTSTAVIFTCVEPGASTFIELAAAKVDEVVLNGAPLDPAAVFDGERIRLDNLAESNRLTVVADGVYSRTGEGLHRFVDPVDEAVYLYTQFETYDAHRMYACFDQPDLKATFTLTVTVPADWKAISNSAVAAVAEAAIGVRTIRFLTTPVMSTYITALVAGPYHEVRDHHDGIDLGLYCRRSLAEFLDPAELFEITKAGFDFYHRVFDYRYPFGKYDQLFVPEFNAGAMENAGCVTFLEEYVFRAKVTEARRERRAETILHEMAHMWFGDLVTMRWWDDLWLNESFATYMSVLAQVNATRFTNGWTTFANAEKGWAYRQDQLSSTHPIVADAPDMDAVRTNFDGITYAKGASVLKQLVAWVGQEEFLAGLRAYFRRYEYANTSLRDLLDELENASGRNLTAWSADWLETTGANTLRPRFFTDSSGLFTSFDVVQEPASAPPTASRTLRPHRLAIGLYDRDATGALVRRERVELDVTGKLTEVAKLVGARQPDLILLNDDDLTYAKVRLDERSLATLVEAIGAISQSLPRTLCWAAAWDMTRDAELAARDYVRLVLSGVTAEDDIGVVQSLLAKADLTIDTYGDPANRKPALRALTERAEELARAAAPGSDLQLVYTTSFAQAEEADQVARIRALFEGTDVIEGLVLDTELRWTLLTQLVARGVYADAEIDTELARDRTATGEKRAATARAARPTAAAKAAAWSAVMDSDTLSNHLAAATMGGFWISDQLELTRPYVDRFFDEIAGIWETRSFDMASTITQMLFPASVIEPETVAKVDAYLAEHNPVPPLRRALLEGRDGLVRALAARKKDIEAAA
ncbi:Membrane alanyl aminopeptidase [Frankia casuarinae]|uniref:aminopeptidase N n=1 Tax=Frankia TaxID=1854 RepID=UPI0003CFC42A|nr:MULTISPECIES: aminopeptidase N [Frankia]ETA03119.1 Membrane alanyl aminopeptidase [Frankia sp. CcI6]EYT92041.1 Membrane alanyl aminopeptidase [Frankia casuarinae]KDA42952.1 Membrane alanyl aminopeptidase [Frankia sp. BMG5.23]OHV54020.1 aminopeptidase N [Frankia sp. CgIS1]TFE34402.1 aminopeptidase N [Frankia sp. B2]